MSRTPLLLRSAPAHGTGSYGVLPIHLDTSDEEDGESGFTRRNLRNAKGKGKSSLRRTVSAQDDGPSAACNAQEDIERARKRKNSVQVKRRKWGSENTVGNVAGGAQGLGSEPRFTTSALPSLDTGRTSVFEGLNSSSESDEDDLLQESNANGSSHDKSHTIEFPDGEVTDDSPYAQVRASVPPTDNVTLSINTPRMWTLAIFFAIFGSATNLFFSLRYPSVSITPVIALLIVHPMGLLWDRILKRSDDPDEVFENGSLRTHKYDGSQVVDGDDDDEYESTTQPGRAPSSLGSFRPTEKCTRRLRLWLAQGRWNEKEHCCVFISSNVSFGFAFATDVIVEQAKFYNQEVPILYQILLTLSTQILGYALAGTTRRFLVRPSGMIWPGTLVSTAMFTSLHKDENKPANGWTISPFRFFFYVFLGSVAFYFLPGLLVPALSWFNVITWFAPRNVMVANLFGVASGLGLFPMTFDWSQIAYIGSPLVVPFWAALNIIGGLVIVMWIMAPIMYYANVLYSSYLPILSSAVFDNTGKPYDVRRILTSDFLFDEEAYKSYSRVFLPITYVLSYALQFAALSALLTHTACWHGRDIWRQWRRSLDEIRSEKLETAYQPVPTEDQSLGARAESSVGRASSESHEPDLDYLMSTEDVHCRLMRRYPDVPILWYFATGATMLAIGIFVVEYYPVHLPWYGLLLALGICAALFIPIGIVMAITNQQSSLYLICQLICGELFPGRPVANMVFVTYGYITSTQGLKFSSDLKLGHYMKVPPRILFSVQVAATVVSGFVQIGVLNWMLAYVPGICTSAAINGFTCPIARVHFNGSILWGVVGPKKFFGPGALYRPLVWAFLVGAVAPVIVYLLGRKNRKSFWRKVNLPVLFGSLSWIPPATGLNFSVWAIVCWIFNDLIRKRKREWWGKYTMTLSAALDSGLAVGVVVIFFGFIFPGYMDGFKWWGTEVYKQGCDWQACPYKSVPTGERFGPDVW